MGHDVTAFERFAGRVGDDTALRVMTRVTIDRVVDELEVIERLVSLDQELDRDQLRALLEVVMRLAYAVSDALPPLERKATGGAFPA